MAQLSQDWIRAVLLAVAILAVTASAVLFASDMATTSGDRWIRVDPATTAGADYRPADPAQTPRFSPLRSEPSRAGKNP